MRKLRTIEMNRLSVDAFKEAPKMPLIVVLDDVRSMYNIGSVFRTSDAFRVEAVYLCGITARPPHPEIHKTALGGEDSVKWRYFATAQEAVEELHRNNYQVYAIEQCEGSTLLQELKIENGKLKITELQGNHKVQSSKFKDQSSSKYAVVFGNEVKGVHQEVVDQCDGCIEIPQFGTKHSMNVSVTAGIVIWEFARLLLLTTALLPPAVPPVP
ncbi:MAG: RNA methyltransferase [Prevotella sp.]|nr:RNA methyltransferase [Prevotella sp.]MBP5356318.1 RNA methyltransferase [Prevotella sp.]